VSHIHPFAVVSPRAELGRDVSVGPFCVIEAGVTIGDGCQLASHVVIKTGTTLGRQNKVFEGAVLGGPPQHIRAGEKAGTLRIGDRNTFREYVTIHRGLSEGSTTIVGHDNFVMISAHVGHDCHLGDHTIVANNVMMSGHVTVQDRAYLSGAVGIHQFCRVGRLAMVGGQAHIVQDVPPYVTVDGDSSRVVGLNSIGLRRNGFGRDQIDQLKAAYRIIYSSGLTRTETIERLRGEFPDGPAAELADFLSTGERGFVRERRLPRGATVKLRVHDKADDDLELRKTA